MNNLTSLVNSITRGDKFMKKTYTIVVHKGEADEGGYWAECLEMKGVFAQGDDIEKIKKDMAKGILLMLEELEKQAKANDKEAELIPLEVQNA